jgi:hypothetical protein
MAANITLGSILGTQNVEPFEDFDLTEIQKVLHALSSEDPFDIGQCEWLQQRTLYAAELLIDMIAKLVKTVSFLETRLNGVKNKVALEYKPTDGTRLTAEMRKQAGESAPEVEELGLKLAQAKGARSALERKYEILLKMHYHLKELGSNQKQSIVSGASKSNGMTDMTNSKEMFSGQVKWK